MLRVAFIEYNLGFRGTQGTVWAYADYNETLLGNKSYIICRTHPQFRNADIHDESIKYFTDRFEVVCTSDDVLDAILNQLKIDIAFVVLGGQVHDVHVPTTVPTITHCIFGTENKEGTLQTAISGYVGNGECMVLPNIIMVHDTTANLRAELGIPMNATVFGRYGGYTTFDIGYVQEAVIEYAQTHPDCYFLFMHTQPFGPALSNVIFLSPTRDLEYKTRFINTCDAMLHARAQGETFGMSVGEFVMKGKLIVTGSCGDTAHIGYLNGQAHVYEDKASCTMWLNKIHMGEYRGRTLNPYSTDYPAFVGERVMPLFQEAFIECQRRWSNL